MQMKKKISIMQIKNGAVNTVDDVVVREYPLTIYLNNKEFITLLCSPDHLEHLVYGFLKSEGIILKPADVKKITINNDKGFAYVDLHKQNDLVEELHGKRIMTTGCGKGSTFYNVLDLMHLKPLKDGFKISVNKVLNQANRLNELSEMFRETGGVHSCCLCSESEILIMREDVGRHNALDKILGEAFVKEINLDDKFMLTSGRISSEMLLKCAKSGISIVVSRSAPTDLAVREAENLNVTIVGFARGQRANVYSAFDRIEE